MQRVDSHTNRAISKILSSQASLITRSQAMQAGLTAEAVRHRLRTEGPWRAVLPGVYLANSNMLAGGQREIAAVLYAGPESVITGPAALWRHRVSAEPSTMIDMLIPHRNRRQDAGFVRFHRTTRMPESPVHLIGIPWAPVARAIADAVRDMLGTREDRALIISAVQRGLCTVEQLAAEVRVGPSRGSAVLRSAIGELAEGVASVAEADLRDLVKRSGLPDPLYNPDLYIGTEFIARPDAWWPQAGVAIQVDSREYHLSPHAWDRDLARHAAMSAQGIIVVHLTPRRLRRESAAVISQLQSTYAKGCQRPRLPIRAVPSATS